MLPCAALGSSLSARSRLRSARSRRVVTAATSQKIGFASDAVSQPQARAKRNLDQLVASDGPLVLVALVGQVDGRWSGVLDGARSSCAKARAIEVRVAQR